MVLISIQELKGFKRGFYQGIHSGAVYSANSRTVTLKEVQISGQNELGVLLLALLGSLRLWLGHVSIMAMTLKCTLIVDLEMVEEKEEVGADLQEAQYDGMTHGRQHPSPWELDMREVSVFRASIGSSMTGHKECQTTLKVFD